MRLILIRHGESKANAKGIRQGQDLDSPLSRNGKRQAKKLAKRLKDEKIDAIYSSDLKRAKQTAKFIAKSHRLKIIFDKRLREKAEEEEKKDMIARAKSFLKDIQGNKSTIAIVGHGGFNRTLLAVMNRGREKRRRLAKTILQGNTSISIIKKKGKSYRITLFNCIKHLKPDNRLIKIFERVQKIPYKICKFDEEKIDKKLQEGDCRHKSVLLYRLLEKKGYRVTREKVIFDWKDLPIPRKILSILKKSGTVWAHDSLRVRVHGGVLHVDPTWDPKLEKKGFPVTKNWSGLEDTKQITKGKLEFYRMDRFDEDCKRKIKINKKEAEEFAEQLNKFLGRD
jgi:broad specificity phosphatase PhoE